MERINKPNSEGIIVIDFEGHVMAECKVEDGNIVILHAMNGYGEPLSLK